MTEDDLRRVAGWLEGAERVLFVTGAGISADSGLPTYRGIGGLYDGVEAADGRPIEDILTAETLHAEPELAWRHIARIEAACRGAKPNRAHAVIAALQQRTQVRVLTQNVDGLHEAAGSRQVIPIHGSVHDLLCTACRHRERVQDYAGLAIPPGCPRCGSLVRPEVVLFGELLPRVAVMMLDRELSRGFDLVFSVGTSSRFPYVVAPLLMAPQWGARTVEVNPGDTELSGVVDVHLRGGAAEALGRLGALLGV